MLRFHLPKKVLPILLLSMCCQQLAAQNTKLPTTGYIEYKDPALEKLLPKSTKIEIIDSGFRHTEGPLWVADSNMLLFTDTKSQTVYRWSEGKGVSHFLSKTGYTGKEPYGDEPGPNGLLLDGKGNLLLCEHGDRRIALLPLSGKWGKRTVTDNFEGKRYNSPNDLVLTSKGILYFTDPPFGLPQQDADPTKQLPHGVYMMLPDGQIKVIDHGLRFPNGIAFSPDERLLYVALSAGDAPHIVVYEVREDGSVGRSKILFDASSQPGLPPGGFDGIKVDRNGNIWATGPGGLLIINKEGKWLGSIHTGAKFANCGWGNDGSVLYITASSFVYRVQTATKGAGW